MHTEVALEFHSELDAAPRARSAVSAALAEWGLPDLTGDAVLVVSELVTNGLLHGGRPVRLRLMPIEAGIRVEVEDRSRIAPVLPLIAQLSASVAPLVNATRPPDGSNAATWSRAVSTAARARRPSRCAECGLACCDSSQGSIAARASGASGVVAW